MAIKILLSKPPSVNHIYGYTSRGGYAKSYITKEGNAWFAESTRLARLQVKNNLPISEDDKLSVYIKLYTAYRQDVDNINKPTLDLLAKHANIIPNDIQVQKLTTEKFSCKKEDQRIEIEIESY